MENQDDNQIQNDDQNKIFYTIIITKNYKTETKKETNDETNEESKIETNKETNRESNKETKQVTNRESNKETNKEKGIDINATLVFAVPVEDQNKFLQEENIQKEVVLVQKCKYYNNGHQYIVDDKISAGSIVDDWKDQTLALEFSDDFPFEKLQYFSNKNNILEWKDNSLELNISIKLIATDLTSTFEERSFKEYPLKTISFDQAAKEYLKGQLEDYKENPPKNKNLSFDKEIQQFPDNYPRFLREKLNLKLQMNQIIQLNQQVRIEQFRIQSSLNIQNVYAYTCYQVKIKSKYFAQPLRILSRKQLSNWENVIDSVELNLNESKVPFIYDSDKITCKHFLIINLQYKKFFQIRGIDILIPIVIFDPDQKHNYCISKNEIEEYFKMKISNSMVTFTLNQQIRQHQRRNSQQALIHQTIQENQINQENQTNQENITNQENQTNEGNIQAHFEQLLNSVDN